MALTINMSLQCLAYHKLRKVKVNMHTVPKSHRGSVVINDWCTTVNFLKGVVMGESSKFPKS